MIEGLVLLNAAMILAGMIILSVGILNGPLEASIIGGVLLLAGTISQVTIERLVYGKG